MSRRHPPEQCGGTDDSETRHCSPVSFLSRTCHTVIAMALPLSVLAFCLELPLLTPRMSTMIMVSFLHCTARGRYASNICACPDVASASHHQRHFVVAARPPHGPPHDRAGARKEAPSRHFSRQENTLPRACSEKAKISKKQGQDSCPANFSLALPKSLNRSEPSGLAGKMHFFMQNKHGQDKSPDKSPVFLREASSETTCPDISRCGVLIL